MGNYISRRIITSPTPSAKLVLSDGTVCSLDHPTNAAELMLEHPGELVFELHSLVSDGNKADPLHADHELDLDHKKAYVMLPAKGGKVPRMSSGEARAILKRSRSVKCPRVNMGVEKEEEVVMLEKGGDGLVTAEMFAERPDFLRRQLSSKLWRPSLDTIEERKRERKVSLWFSGTCYNLGDSPIRRSR